MDFAKLAANRAELLWSAGDCYDDAMAESFFATLECELIERSSFQTQILA